MSILDSAALPWSLAALCVAAALWAALRALSPHRAIDTQGVTALVGGYLCPESEIAEVGMLAAMAAMLAVPAAPAGVWRLTFAVIAVAVLAQLALSRPSAGRIAAGCFHLLAAVAMVYSTLGHGGHSAHLAGPPVPTLGWLFVIAFAVDAVTVAVLVLSRPGRLGSTRVRLMAAALPHLIMDIVMIAMLYHALTGGSGHG